VPRNRRRVVCGCVLSHNCQPFGSRDAKTGMRETHAGLFYRSIIIPLNSVYRKFSALTPRRPSKQSAKLEESVLHVQCNNIQRDFGSFSRWWLISKLCHVCTPRPPISVAVRALGAENARQKCLSCRFSDDRMGQCLSLQ
jgi:hypothetical protein